MVTLRLITYVLHGAESFTNELVWS